MPTTSPDNIYFADTGTTSNDVNVSAAEATSVQAALNRRQGSSYQWANAAARTAQTGMVNGSLGYQEDTKTYWSYDGIIWKPLIAPATSYTASFTGLTVGNGVINNTWFRVGDFVFVYGSITLGTTSAVTGPIVMSLPVIAAARYGATNATNNGGPCTLLWPAVLFVSGFCQIVSTSTVELVAAVASTAYVQQSQLSSTIPFTWAPASGKFISWAFSYQAA